MDFTQSENQVTTHLGDFTFVWGEIQAIHFLAGSGDIDYMIVEHLSTPSFIVKEGAMGGGGELHFHTYIIQLDGVIHDTGHGYSSIEAAIVGVIAFRFDGLNTQAGSFFMKVIGTETAKEWLPLFVRYPDLYGVHFKVDGGKSACGGRVSDSTFWAASQEDVNCPNCLEKLSLYNEQYPHLHTKGVTA